MHDPYVGGGYNFTNLTDVTQRVAAEKNHWWRIVCGIISLVRCKQDYCANGDEATLLCGSLS
jgi:hypothetical protein